MPSPTASIVICTRNRASVFRRTCDAVLSIAETSFEWEVVIVDNASTDGTNEVASDFAQRASQPVRLVREEILGLSKARNTGIETARGNVILFLDDDAIPWTEWLPRLVDALSESATYAAGGPVEPNFTSELPAWFSDRFLPYLTVWDLGPEVIDLHYNEYPRGANIAFRREAFERFGLFSTDLGRKADSLLSCEEIELCLRIERGGKSVKYVPGAGVDHRVDGSRVTPAWLQARFRAQGASEAIVDWQHAGLPGLFAGARASIRRARHSLRSEKTDDGLVRKCELAAASGYLSRMLTCPARIPRYRPSAEAGPASPWRPPF